MPNDLKGINPRGTETFLPCHDTTARSGVETINNKIGANSGIASLDANGKVPSSQLPSFVDDVVEGYYKAADDRFYEESTYETLITPTSGKSWVDVSTNKSYRWTGSVYVRVDEGVQIGETADTAFAGNRGKALETAVAGIKDGSSINSFGGVETALSNKVDKVNGKGLSTNDFTDAYKEKVDGAFPRSEQTVLGAKNLLPNELITTTDSGVTFTHNADETVKLNGTASANIVGVRINRRPITDELRQLLNGAILSGWTKTSYTGTANWNIVYRQANLDYISEQVGSNGADITINIPASAEVMDVKIWVGSGAVFSNNIFYPMITLASDSNIGADNFKPHAMTNRELTEKVTQSVEDVKATFKSEAVIIDSPITDVESAIKVRYGNLLFFTARVNKASNTAINKNFSFPLTFPETLKSVCMINLNSPYGAGTASFDVNNKGMAVRYVSADSATYVDISMILLVA